ncbi:MAG: hypothetical protein J6X97_09085 [Lachnospiraceae bacterium]|nr:hypothetical protein [Lachnospiraceae bacterium]
MANKVKEFKCLEKVIKCWNNKGKIASNLHQILVNNRKLIDYDNERPDIIINSETEVMGIEHCRADMFFRIKRKRAQSMIGIHESEGEKLVEKYEDEELLDEDIRNGNALNSILSIVEDGFDIRNNFKYENFIDNFKRVCNEHNNKSKDYRVRLNEIAKNKQYTLACLIEIPYTKERNYYIKDSKGLRKQSLNGIPITWDMLKTIQGMQGFDFVILCMYNLYDVESVQDYVCYYFVPKFIEVCIKQQIINPVNSFGLTKYPHISFPPDKYSIDEEGKITFITEYSFKS